MRHVCKGNFKSLHMYATIQGNLKVFPKLKIYGSRIFQEANHAPRWFIN